MHTISNKVLVSFTCSSLLSDFSSSCVCPSPSGVLCGECRNGSGVSALLNRCVTCSNAMGLLVAVLGEKRESTVGYCSVVVIK